VPAVFDDWYFLYRKVTYRKCLIKSQLFYTSSRRLGNETKFNPMKVKIFLLVFSIAGFLIIFPSCKKSNDQGTSTNSITATLTAPSGTTSFKSTANIFGNFYNVSQMYYLQGAQVVAGDSLILCDNRHFFG
jgi:hypothetical protein